MADSKESVIYEKDDLGRPIVVRGDASIALSRRSGNRAFNSEEEAVDAQKRENQRKVLDTGTGKAAAFVHGMDNAMTAGTSDYRDKVINEFLMGKDRAVQIQELKDANESVNPISSGLGTAAGLVAPALISGGTSVLARAGVGGAGLAGAELIGGGAAAATRGAIATGIAEGAEALGANAVKGALGRALAGSGAGMMDLAGTLAEQQAARVLGEGALARVGAQAARYGAEGALYGLSDQASRNLVHDKPITSELWSATAGGALLGGIGGAAGASLGIAGQKALVAAGERIEGRAAKLLGVGDFVEKSVAKEVKAGGNAATARSNVIHGITDIMEGKISASAEEALRMSTQARDGAGKLIGSIAKEFEQAAPKVTPSVPSLMEKLGAIKSEFAHTSFAPVVAEKMAFAEAAMSKMENKPISAWIQEATNLRQYMGEVKLTDNGALSATLQKSINERLLGSINTTIKEAMVSAEKASPRLEGKAAQFEAAKVQYGLASELAKASEARLAAEGTGKAGKAAAFGPAEVAGIVSSVLSGHGGLGLAYGVAKKVAGGAAASPKVTEALYRMASAAKMAEATGQVSNGIRSGLQKFFGATGKGATIAANRSNEEKTTRSSYEKALNESIELSSDLHREKIRKYADTLASQSPVVAEGLLSQYDRARQYLSENRPPSQVAGSLISQPKLAGLSQAEMSYLNKDKVIKNPASVVSMLANGTITKESVDAIKTVYPNMYKEMVEFSMNFVQEHMAKGKTLPFQKVVGLGILLGQPLIPIMEPGVMADIQASMVPTQQPGRPKSADADANSQAKADSTLTASEKVEQK